MPDSSSVPAPPSFFVIPIDIKRRLKVAAAQSGRTMRGIVTAAIVREVEAIEAEQQAAGEKGPKRKAAGA